jgi:hypothetical protein
MTIREMICICCMNGVRRRNAEELSFGIVTITLKHRAAG